MDNTGTFLGHQLNIEIPLIMDTNIKMEVTETNETLFRHTHIYPNSTYEYFNLVLMGELKTKENIDTPFGHSNTT